LKQLSRHASVGGSESKRANVSHATSCAQCGLTCHRVAPRDP
jgi:hypothetical protein